MARSHQQKLLARRSYVASDLYVEEVARRELKWARPNEIVVVVMPTPEAVASSDQGQSPAAGVGPVARTPVEAWWLLFFGKQSFPSYTRASP